MIAFTRFVFGVSYTPLPAITFETVSSEHGTDFAMSRMVSPCSTISALRRRLPEFTVWGSIALPYGLAVYL